MSWFKKNSSKHDAVSALKAPAKVLMVSDYLSDRSVHFFSHEETKKELLARLVKSLAIPDHGTALKAVLEREERGGTVVGAAISIPHARLKGLKTVELAVGVSAKAADGHPKLYFLFLSPEEDTKSHLLFLSSLSSLFQSDGFVELLTGSTAAHEVVQRIRKIEKGV